MENLYFLVYNNSYNQTFRREKTLTDYLKYQVGEVIGTFLWNENDGVNTSVTLNYEHSAAQLEPDYCIVYNTEEGIITSRWFVTEMRRTRNGQYIVSLERDVIADSYEILPQLKVKAIRGLLPQDNSLIIQKEDISVNQIKTKEQLIKDATGVPWIVGYIAQKADSTFNKVTGLTSYERPNQVAGGFENFPYWANTTYRDHAATPFKGIPYDFDVNFNFLWSRNYGINKVLHTDIEVQIQDRVFFADQGYHQTIEGYYRSGNFNIEIPSVEEVKNAFHDKDLWYNEVVAAYDFPTQAEIDAFIKMDGQIIQDTSTGKFYKYTLKRTRFVDRKNWDSAAAKEKFPTINNTIKTQLNAAELSPIGSDVIKTMAAYWQYTLELEEQVSVPTYTYEISTTRKHTKDAPYDLICIPYGEFNGVGSKELALDLSAQIINQNAVGANGVIYDFQILPYCPLQNWNINELTENIDYTKVKDSASATLAYVYYCDRSSFKNSFSLQEPVTVEDKKIDYVCNSYRFVSPNYNSQFEISAAANGEGFSLINVSCTYMPFNPYIKVAPAFGGLYGKDFGDARGLICGGDFSLPIVNDAWVSYQQQNKNYNAIFERNIQSMEFTHGVQQTQDIINAVVGTIGGIATGASGFAIGKGWGIGGTILGTVGSAATGIADIFTNRQLRQEQIDLTKDMQVLNLGNIQAMPMGISKTTAFNADNKIFPILETYTCSLSEKAAVIELLINRSFTIGAIMNLKDLLNTSWYAPTENGSVAARNWIAASPIAFPQNFGKDSHFTAALASRLSQGYYFDNWEE